MATSGNYTGAGTGEFTVRVRGYREATRALQAVDAGTRKAVLAGLKEAAAPVAADANRRLDRYRAIGQITTRASNVGVFIRQSHRKVTGKRADFGRLQMVKGLIPAATDGEPLFVDRVDHALGLLIAKERLE